MHHRYANTPAARRVDDALRASGLSAREVAEAIGIPANLLSMVRTGQTAIPARRCGALARALGLDPCDLMGDYLLSYGENRSWQAAGMALGLAAHAVPTCPGRPIGPARGPRP